MVHQLLSFLEICHRKTRVCLFLVQSIVQKFPSLPEISIQLTFSEPGLNHFSDQRSPAFKNDPIWEPVI